MCSHQLERNCGTKSEDAEAIDEEMTEIMHDVLEIPEGKGGCSHVLSPIIMLQTKDIPESSTFRVTQWERK